MKVWSSWLYHSIEFPEIFLREDHPSLKNIQKGQLWTLLVFGGEGVLLHDGEGNLRVLPPHIAQSFPGIFISLHAAATTSTTLTHRVQSSTEPVGCQASLCISGSLNFTYTVRVYNVKYIQPLTAAGSQRINERFQERGKIWIPIFLTIGRKKLLPRKF